MAETSLIHPASGAGTDSVNKREFTGGQNSTVEGGMNWNDLEKELTLFDGQIFQSDESCLDRFATPFKYVPSVGRGTRKTPDPNDIRLPRAFYENLRHKNPLEAPFKFKQSAGRGRILRNFTTEIPLPNNPMHDTTRTVDQNQHRPSSISLHENFLGATTRGLTSEIMEGKACLMEKFLGKSFGQETYNPFETHQHAPRSLRSTQTAPTLNFHNMDQWPNISGGTCQSDCGQKGGSRCGADGSAHPKKSPSLQEIIRTMSSTTNWDRSSQRNSSNGEGSKKLRKMKSKQEDVATHKEKEALGMREAAALPPSRADAVRGERTSGDGVTQTSRNQQGAIPTGANLIQLECLPEDITEGRLRAVLSGFGPVVDCHILRDNDTQKCIGIAFVRFENSKACLMAVSRLHEEESPFHGLDSETNIPKLGVHMVT